MRYRVCQKLTGFFRRQTSALVDPALDPVLEIEKVLKSYSREQCLCWRWFVAYRDMKQVAVSVTMALKPAENHCQKQLSALGLRPDVTFRTGTSRIKRQWPTKTEIWKILSPRTYLNLQKGGAESAPIQAYCAALSLNYTAVRPWVRLAFRTSGATSSGLIKTPRSCNNNNAF